MHIAKRFHVGHTGGGPNSINCIAEVEFTDTNGSSLFVAACLLGTFEQVSVSAESYFDSAVNDGDWRYDDAPISYDYELESASDTTTGSIPCDILDEMDSTELGKAIRLTRLVLNEYLSYPLSIPDACANEEIRKKFFLAYRGVDVDDSAVSLPAAEYGLG